MVAYTCFLWTLEADAQPPQVQGQLGLHSEFQARKCYSVMSFLNKQPNKPKSEKQFQKVLKNKHKVAAQLTVCSMREK